MRLAGARGPWRRAHLAMDTDRPCGSRSGSLVSPLPPRPSAVASRVPEVFRFPSALSMRTSSPSLLFRALPFALVFRPSLLGSVHTSQHARCEMCLSPLHRRARSASTPGMAACHPFGLEGSTFEVLFRPRGFSPPRRFPPLLESRACCIPLPILGFSAFPSCSPGRRPGRSSAFPRCRIRTPRRNPLPTAAPHRCGRCPRAVLPRPPPRLGRFHRWDWLCRGGRTGSVGFEALLRRRVWCLSPAVAGVRDPLLPGLCFSSRSFATIGGPASRRRVTSALAGTRRWLRSHPTTRPKPRGERHRRRSGGGGNRARRAGSWTAWPIRGLSRR